jgi:hypothetical protein
MGNAAYSYWCRPQRTWPMPNYAFERTGDVTARARVRLVPPLPPSARLKRLRPAAQRER